MFDGVGAMKFSGLWKIFFFGSVAGFTVSLHFAYSIHYHFSILTILNYSFNNSSMDQSGKADANFHLSASIG
jgi:hypothetical protein